jgi:hypothetical protein
VAYSTKPEYDDGMVGGSDVLVQPGCISVHLSVAKGQSGAKQCSLEVDVKPMEITYRDRTISNITNLISTFSQSRSQGSRELSTKHRFQGDQQAKENSVHCNLASVTLTFPLLREHDSSLLFHRCGHSVEASNLTQSAVGIAMDNLSFEFRQSVACKPDDCSGNSDDNIVGLELHRFVVFALSADGSDATLGRRMHRMDILVATGRFEVDPYIPIAIEYRQNSIAETNEQNAGKKSFPIVPPFSSFKARQEDEDEEDKIDRILSEKLSDVDVDTRRALRAKDPQNKMLSEAGNCSAVVNMHIPEIVGDLSKDELVAFMEMIQLIFPNHGEGKSASHAEAPSVAISIACDTMSLALHTLVSEGGSPFWNSYLVRLDRCRAHTVCGGASMKYLRVLSHETSFFESTLVPVLFCSLMRPKVLTVISLLVSNRVETCQTQNPLHSVGDRVCFVKERIARKVDSSAVPIFYRSKLLPAISHGSPTFLLDILRPTNEDNIDEQSVFLSVYNMTHRYDPDSKWIDRLQALVGDLSSRQSESSLQEQFYEAIDADMSQPEINESTSLTRVSNGRFVFSFVGFGFCFLIANLHPFQVFVSLADCSFDYTSLKQFNTASRSILRIGDLRLSSNILSPAGSVQAFSISVGDISWYLCNNRYPYNFENSLLLGASLIIAPEDISFIPPPMMESRNISPSEIVFREMGFKTILTLESIDAIIKRVQPQINQGDGLLSQEPRLTISLTAGELSLYACKDSFQCFTSTIGDLQAKATAVSNEELEELRAKSLYVLKPSEVIEQERFFDSRSGHEQNQTKTETSSGVGQLLNHSQSLGEREFLPMEANGEFLLDGYDWTTIDHDPTVEIPPGDEQVARWYIQPPASEPCENGGLSASFSMPSTDSQTAQPQPPLRLISQHFPLHVSNPLGDGDMGAAKFAGTKAIVVQSRILLHDMKFKVRFFDGYDWPESKKPRKSKQGGLFVIDEPVSEEQDDSETSTVTHDGDASKGRKAAALMGGLLAGGPDDTSTFRGLPLPEERAKSLLTQNELRRLARRTNSYMQFSAAGVRLRVDSYLDSIEHRLNSCLDLSMTDFFVAETISSFNPVKLMGEWFNEEIHPRDSRDGILMLKVNLVLHIFDLIAVFVMLFLKDIVFFFALEIIIRW